MYIRYISSYHGIFGIVEGGPTKASADGFYIITEPLQRGNHTINFKSSRICSDPDCADPNFAQDITYNIIAEQIDRIAVSYD